MRADEDGRDAPTETKTVVGWREWVELPELDLPGVKAKIDTGARTSALHAFDIARERDADGRELIAFSVHPLQRDPHLTRRCRAPLIDVRRVTDSGGHAEQRYFVATELRLGPIRRRIELTLTERHDMLFRMLIGRTALAPKVIVDPARSFLLGRRRGRALYPPIAPETSR